jgi:hypothetical protein
MLAVVAADAQVHASGLQLWGAGAFGAVLGWFVYFVNRHRREGVKLIDVGSLVGAVAGAAVLALFPAGTDLFGAYGIGLAVGFFGYFVVLVVLVAVSPGYTVDFLIGGRAPALGKDEEQAEPHPFGPPTGTATDGRTQDATGIH